MRSVFIAAATVATSIASSAARTAASVVRSTVAANPQVPLRHDPDGQAQLVGVQQGLQVPVGQADVLAADPLGAEVGVLGAQLAGPLQGSRGQLAQRVPGELRIDRMQYCAPRVATYPAPAGYAHRGRAPQRREVARR